MTNQTEQYEQARVGVDAVIFTINEDELLVYLNKREKEPFNGLAELPGGLLLHNETAEETLLRKLSDTIGDHNVYYQQFHTFSDPNRDPRMRTITVGFIALVAGDKVADIHKFHKLSQLPPTAFDHGLIIRKAAEHLKRNMDAKIISQFMPQYFPLNDLQKVYEAIGEVRLDNRNFRKKMLNMGVIKKLDKKEEGVTHRPAALFKFV